MPPNSNSAPGDPTQVSSPQLHLIPPSNPPPKSPKGFNNHDQNDPTSTGDRSRRPSNTSSTTAGSTTTSVSDVSTSRTRKKGPRRRRDRDKYQTLHLYKGHHRHSYILSSNDLEELTELRARDRTFDGAYIRTALGNLSYSLVILKIFSPEFAKIGICYVVIAGVIMFIGLQRRRHSNHDMADLYRQEEQQQQQRDQMQEEEERILRAQAKALDEAEEEEEKKKKKDQRNKRVMDDHGDDDDGVVIGRNEEPDTLTSSPSSRHKPYKLDDPDDDLMITQQQQQQQQQQQVQSSSSNNNNNPNNLQKTSSTHSHSNSRNQSKIPSSSFPPLSQVHSALNQRQNSFSSFSNTIRRTFSLPHQPPPPPPPQRKPTKIWGRNFQTSGQSVLILAVCVIGLEVGLFFLVVAGL